MLTSLSLRRSLPLLLGIFGLLFTVMLTAWHLPTRIEETSPAGAITPRSILPCCRAA